jgi:hypothetical protein
MQVCKMFSSYKGIFMLQNVSNYDYMFLLRHTYFLNQNTPLR